MDLWSGKQKINIEKTRNSPTVQDKMAVLKDYSSSSEIWV